MTHGTFMIGGHTFKAKTFKETFESLTGPGTGRTADGVLHIDWIYRRLRKLEIEMPPMSAKEASTLLSLVQGKEYDITYHDILENNVKGIRVYTGNSEGDCYNGIVRNGLWQGVAFHAIEIEGEA